MSPLLDLLSYEFIRNAIYAGLLASILCGVIGTFVVVKRLVFVSGGITHAAFGGLGLCHYLGLDPRFGAAAVAVVAAVALGQPGPGRARSPDAVIGILWAVGMALGIVFIHLTPGYAPNLMAYLFGNVLTVGRSDVLLTSALVVVVLGLLVLFFKEFVAVTFDDEFAEVQGVPVRIVMTFLMVLIGLSVVFLIQVVGIILVIALLTIPPVISLRLMGSFVGVLISSTVVGAVMTLGGLVLSYAYDLPSGPAIVLVGAVLLMLVDLERRLRRRTDQQGEGETTSPREAA